MPYTPPTLRVIDDNNNDNIDNTSRLIRRLSAPEKPSLKVIISPPQKEILPCLIRKKSGEIVKPSLKNGYSKSEPTTPTFPKNVHFNEVLEDVRLFNGAQEPQAASADVSADVSDDDTDDENDSVFSEREDDEDEHEQLKISLSNMPTMITFRNSKPVFVESIFLDKKNLQGRIMVQNIAFEKDVCVKYTFDYWSTTSMVPATYLESVNNFDAFFFSIELTDNSRNSIDGKTMYFAVQYQVDNRNFWDNNNGLNYQVNFKKIISLSSSSFPSTPSTPPQRASSKNNLDENFCELNESLLAIEKVQQSDNAHMCKYSNKNFKDFFPNNYVDGMPMSGNY